ncbi:MAG: helix-turn-helix domain-containing protein [Lachnospiraceae bacterium]|nr:helix-turn-helix domain-containing protein [Lachnospiraceae bacterium]
MGKKLTKEEIEKIEKMRQEGANVMRIAEKVGRCRNTVERVLKERGYTIGVPAVKSKETYKIPLYPEDIRLFRDSMQLGDVVYMQDEGIVKRYNVIEKYTYFVRLKMIGSRRPHKSSASYIDLIISGRSGEENGSK